MKKECDTLSVKMKSLLLALTAVTVTILFCLTAASAIKVHAAETLDAWDITDQMTIGWNLGNSLDSIFFDGDNPTPQQSVTAWGNPEPTLELFQTVKNLGFNTVRIPVTWYQHMEYNASTDRYDIDDDWMEYVKNTVNDAYNLGMFVIINVHHEEWINVEHFNDTNLKRAKTILEDIWQQVSEEFADYDYHLIFEGMNEPRETYDPAVEWGKGNANSWNYINTLNSVFINIVRSSRSAENQNRLLMIPSYHATDDAETLEHLEIPSDAGNVAISVHAYEPYSFTMDKSEAHVYETDNQYGKYIPQLLDNVMNDLKAVQQSKGAPIIIGEFGASDFNNTSERVKWATDYITKAKEAGFVCVLWDNNANDDFTSSENWGCINRANNQLYPNAQAVVQALTSAYNKDLNKDPSEDPNKDLNKDFNNAVSLYQSSGTQLGAWSSITVSENVDYINEDYQIAVSYSGNSAPKLIIENKYDYSWDVNVTPNDVQDGVAYYNYGDIADRMNTFGVSIYDMGKVFTMASDNTIIYDIYALPTDSNDYDSSWKEVYGSQGAVTLSAWSSFVATEDLSCINKNYDIAVVYNGNAAPKLVLENKYDYSWNVNIEAAKTTDNNIAYYSYADIAQCFSKYGVSIYDMGKMIIMASDDTIVYDIYAVPTDSNDYDYSWKEVYGSQGAVTLSAWSGFVAAEDLSCINKNYDIVVVYKGNAAPKLVLENKYDYSWNVNIEAAKTTDNNIAYYSYTDIAQCFSKYGVSIYDMGKLIFMASCDTEIYGVYAAPVY